MKKIIIGILVLVILAIVGGYVYLQKQVDHAMAISKEAVLFGRDSTKMECVDRFSDDFSECQEIGCLKDSSIFLGACMGEASGDIDQLCKTVVFEGRHDSYCKEYALEGEQCEMLILMIKDICNNQTY